MKATGIKALGGAAGGRRNAGIGDDAAGNTGRQAAVAGPARAAADDDGRRLEEDDAGRLEDDDVGPAEAFETAQAGRRGRRAAELTPDFHVAGAAPADLPGFETMNG